jgi:pimeloyl-ACP methyl ester carboxylesterase
MNDITELRQFAQVHARSLNIRNYRDVLARIDNDDDGAPGSWTGVWTEAGDRLLSSGRPLQASRHYAMARFPFPDGPAREAAGAKCVSAFDAWRRDRGGIERLDVDLPAGRVSCWAAGLSGPASGAEPLPLLLIMGGIVSAKEQIAPALVLLRRLGVAAVVTEMPGIGENTLRYDADSWRMLSAVMDAVADRADVARTYAYTFSFSGHLALRCAAEDPRIKAVFTSGAPVRDFFTSEDWQRTVPRITMDTLACLAGAKSLAGAKGDDTIDHLSPLALTDEQLDAIRIPVNYLASSRDEIIPASETGLLTEHVPGLRVIENDDVHASPKYLAESLAWLLISVLRLRGPRDPRYLAAAAMWYTLRARHRIARWTR